MELTFYHYLFLFVGAGFSGFVDSIAGGGGIISIPLLLTVGVPPHAAIATNKLQSSFGSFTSMMRYRHAGLFTFRTLYTGIIFTAIGAASGAVLIQFVDAGLLAKAIPFILTALLIYTIASPDLGIEDGRQKVAERTLFVLFGLLLGFYDGFFGPGTGSFWTLALVSLAGYNIRKGTATTKVMNFTSNCVSLTVFLLSGKVIFLIGLVMGLGQLVGAWMGSHLVLTKGTRFIRLFFIIVVSVTIIDQFIKQFF